jgi:hypothetical protein
MKQKTVHAYATCCKDLLPAKNLASPFTQVIATGYYDGETCGFTRCDKCAEAFAFRLAGWDPSQDIRVFVLCPIPAQSFDTLFNTFAGLESPRSPVWVPDFQSFDPDTQATVKGIIDRVEELRAPPVMVIATRHIEKQLIAVSAVSDKDIDYLPSESSTGNAAWEYWKKRLGLQETRGRDDIS